ncbi:VWA domain-containing protein [uncultured Parasphingorhabdus sp.]|uniref:vWA domain-containing protein n=1 Tax=uncultured Parasphingorhabdus sp. TaxID=2709694 RepID=UPI002AA7B520|nr:VWA domain-containing protein [uncultured Parasphingorhabdus sp.]
MRHFNIPAKTMSMLAVTGLALTSAAPSLDARSIARPAAPDPVNCSIFSRPRADHITGRRSGVALASPSMVPAPPPPPPSQVVVTASKSAASGMAAAERSIAPHPLPRPYQQPQDRERYDGKDVASIKRVADAPVSTFAVDVDTGSYSNVRRFLNDGQMPPEAAVRTEEMINYFRYDYPRPQNRDTPFSVSTDISTTPWNDASRLLRIGLRGYDVASDERPRANLVFLVDVSGSMNSRDKLPLVKSTLTALAGELRSDDRVSIVVYSGTVGLLLAPTSNKDHVKEAVDCLSARGSTAGGDALKLAYSTARDNFIDSGINRIIMATDGDFNVGTSDTDELKKYVAKQRESGVTLTMLGYGSGNIRDELMEGIANVGNGNYAYIDSAMEARKVLGSELSSTLFTIAKDVKIQIEFNPAHVKEYRLIGYENRLLAEEDFANDKIDAGDIGAGHQVTALYEIMPADASGWLPERRYPANRVTDGRSDLGGEMAHVKLRYKLPDEDRSRLISRPIAAGDMRSASEPRGDMAFAVAVAAFGQKLRGDKYLGSYDFRNIGLLSGKGGDYWRQEFRKLNDLADSNSSS